MKTVLMKFAGPLQSWGTSSHFEMRHTDLHPSKSAVIGVIAAALGYQRDEENKIRDLNKLQFAVRTDQAGNITDDYQTAHKYKFNPYPLVERTYVTHRYYLEDAVFVAAVGSENDQWLDEIVYALRHPYFQLYMGRRSCPLPEDFILKVVDQDVITALQQEPLHSSEWYRKRHSGPVFIFADAKLLPEKPSALRRDTIASLSWEDRNYEWRQEAETHFNVSNCQEEHDAFGALGD
ncbi:MAG: type I-E CRISPR-associated protein Cas5/CasD [Lachnospiraceae bacterium]|jgi:CRISPR system Cascade subunit CasD|nr:type I-E CRISPR-associated protein Cas5/CasD [Lachnospiraceae bacterium]MCH4029932.1 type I-E CRISPR-associated protein Cas5/CasD [Lachnospiraceae bacterium]MCH4070407.1 type I-E CRISPR-associated protein Cas5/CasD [Lachnospiraceae bacterium]MCI1331634.1 type I-E CRISPR-associated protein Cas5/CasD [Lachnospiraceae bacterium]MCI1401521.1 type I-E CRISPR-associated protein Cas5/CasD [Lachnospiraceae bacterium]